MRSFGWHEAHDDSSGYMRSRYLSLTFSIEDVKPMSQSESYILIDGEKGLENVRFVKEIATTHLTLGSTSIQVSGDLHIFARSITTIHVQFYSP